MGIVPIPLDFNEGRDLSALILLNSIERERASQGGRSLVVAISSGWGWARLPVAVKCDSYTASRARPKWAATRPKQLCEVAANQKRFYLILEREY